MEKLAGALLKPVFKKELLQNNKAKSKYRVVTLVGRIPNHLRQQDFSPSMVLIQNGEKCKYIVPGYVPSGRYQLRPVQPVFKDPGNIAMLSEGIIQSQQVEYQFKTNITSPVRFPVIQTIKEPVYAVQITAYSSVEGDSAKNEILHQQRANAIQDHIKKHTGVRDTFD